VARVVCVVNLRTISWLSRLHHGANFVDGLSAFFPLDSRPSRVFAAASKFAYGLDNIAQRALERERGTWSNYNRVAAIQAGIKHYGEHIITINETFRHATEIWRIVEHVVLWDKDWIAGAFMSASSLDEIAAEVLAHAGQEFGTGTRIALSRDGLGPDAESVSEIMRGDVSGVIATLRAELAVGHRSLLIHGPAGSGKTAASRQIVEHLADSALVVSSDALILNDDDPFAMICMWRPKAVVFDDLDRPIENGNEAWVLGGLSRIRAVVPLVVATANVTDDFSGALLRPGRFDRVMRIDDLDVSVLRAITPNVPHDVRERAQAAGLLAAYCAELDIRCRCGADPSSTLDEMIERQAKSGDGARPVGRRGNGPEHPRVMGP